MNLWNKHAMPVINITALCQSQSQYGWEKDEWHAQSDLDFVAADRF